MDCMFENGVNVGRRRQDVLHKLRPARLFQLTMPPLFDYYMPILSEGYISLVETGQQAILITSRLPLPAPAQLEEVVVR